MANIYNAGTPQKIQTLITNLTNSLGNGLAMDLSKSVGFTIVMKLSDDGTRFTLSEYPSNQGLNLKPDFKIDTGTLP